MSNLIFLSVLPRSREPIKASLFKCPTTHAQVLSNECMVPMSPYKGRPMQRITPKRISIDASEIEEGTLMSIGKCADCGHALLANDKAISSLAGEKPRCIMCGGNINSESPEMVDQVIDQVIRPSGLDEDENLHDDPDILHGDPKYADVGLNDQLLASEILAEMEQDDGDDEDTNDEDDDDDYNDDDEDDDEDYDDESYDNDDTDEDDEDYDDDDEDEDEENNLSPNDYYDEDENEDDDNHSDEHPQQHEYHMSDDDDSTMDATAAEMAIDDEMMEDEDGMPHTNDVNAITTMEGDPMARDSSLRQVAINASDALHSIISADDAVMAVLPIDNNSAMILAMVENVGYMPYVAIEASKAAEDLKPLFANPSKLVSTVNTVIANSNGNILKDLRKFGVRPLNYSVRASSLIEKRIKDGVTAATEALNDEKNHIVEDLRQCLAIAATQVLKNLSDDSTNVVSAALSESLKQIGVRNADVLVDEAFTKHGPELMKTIIAKALELMDKPYDVRNEIAKYVTAATTRNVSATTASTVGERVAKTLAGGSLPVSVQAPAGNTVESADAANVIPITASTNIDYSTIVKAAASRRLAR